MTIISHYIMVTVYLFGVIIIYLMASMLSTDVSIMGHCLILRVHYLKVHCYQVLVALL